MRRVGTGVAGDPPAGRGINGIDDAGNKIAGPQHLPMASWIAPMKCSPRRRILTPLRGIQVKIRAFEPDSKQSAK